MTEKKSLTLFFVGILITCLSYWQGLNGVFLLDDFSNITPTIIHELNLQKLIEIAFGNTSGTLGRPIPTLSFALTSYLHGTESWGFKYHNLLLHLLCGIALFGFISKLARTLQKEQKKLLNNVNAVIVVFWLIHPLHVSTVLYVVQRMTQLSFLFTLLSLTFYLYGFSTHNKAKKYLSYFIFFPLFSLLGAFSKESAALIPLYIFILYIFLINQKNTGYTIQKIDKLFIYFFSITPLLIGTIFLAIHFERFIDYSNLDFTLKERLLSEINTVTHYIRQLLVPNLSQMGLYFDGIPVQRQFNPSVTLNLLVLSSALLYGVYQWKKGHLIGLGILLFFAGHLLESTIFPLEIKFEHRNYFPSIGILMACICAIFSYQKYRKFSIILTIAALIIFTSILNLRVGFWKDQNSWIRTAVAFHPNSGRTLSKYIEHLKRSNQQDLAIKKLETLINEKPQMISLKTSYLSNTCEKKTALAKQVANDLEESLKNKTLTVLDLNNLSALIHKASFNGCLSIQKVQLKRIVEFLLKKAYKNDEIFKMHLHILSAKLDLSMEQHISASNHYKKAYSLTQNPDDILSAVKAKILSPDEDTRSEGIDLFNDILQRKYFDINKHKQKVLTLIRKLESGDLTFSF